MPRPRKSENEKRRKWAVLNVTPEERRAIEQYAHDAGLGVSAYIIARALQKPVAPRDDWKRIARQQALLLAAMEDIAARLITAEPVADAGAALLSLRRIETQLESHQFHSEPDAPC